MLLLVAAGCPEAKPECDTGAWCGYGDGDTGSTTGDVVDTGTTWVTEPPDTVPPPDTGIAQAFWVGDFDFRVTTVGARAGDFGWSFYGLRSADWACWHTETLPYEGPAESCPGCDFSFDLGPANAHLGEDLRGPYCAELGISAGQWDGYFDYSWGYAASYQYDYGGGGYLLEHVLFLEYGGSWMPFAFDYGARDDTSGSAADGTLQVQHASGTYYYYGI